VFPNPASNEFTIKKLTNINLKSARINDINGRLIKQVDLSQMQSAINIDISEVASGIYFMEILSDLGMCTKCSLFVSSSVIKPNPLVSLKNFTVPVLMFKILN